MSSRKFFLILFALFFSPLLRAIDNHGGATANDPDYLRKLYNKYASRTTRAKRSSLRRARIENLKRHSELLWQEYNIEFRHAVESFSTRSFFKPDELWALDPSHKSSSAEERTKMRNRVASRAVRARNNVKDGLLEYYCKQIPAEDHRARK